MPWKVEMGSIGSLMSLTCADQVFTVEFEDHFVGTHNPNNICVNIRDRIAGDLKGERPTPWVSEIITKLFKVIDYLTIKVGHLSLLLSASCGFVLRSDSEPHNGALDGDIFQDMNVRGCR
jgi:hypothetical protein